MENTNAIDIDRPVSRVLLIGMEISMALMLIGVILLITHTGSKFSTVLPPAKALSECMKLHAQGWLSLGILALIVTPVARVIMAIISFAWIRDRKYALVSVVVFTAMMTGLLLKKG